MKRHLLLIAMLLLAGCVRPRALVIRDREAAAKVKTVAVLPFFDAQMQTAFDPLYNGSGASMVPALNFDKQASAVLGKRYQVIDQQKSVEALKELGVKYVHAEGAWQALKDPESIRWGYTLAQAVQAGKNLGADAILLGAQGQFIQANEPLQAVSLRLVDTITGKTLLALNATGKVGLFTKDIVVRTLLATLVKEAP